MNADYIKGLVEHLEEIGASSDVIDEVVAALPEVTKSPEESVKYTLGEMIIDDPDWRQRASMAARNISSNLDNGY